MTAKADRIEVRGAVADVLDFKTGAPPTAPQVRSGLAPQLTLTAAILARGGFDAVGRIDVGDLAEHAMAGLKRRVQAFDLPATPYVSWAAPQFIGRYGGDYDHLARHWEWGVIGGDEADAE